jgi:hypothetical protein
MRLFFSARGSRGTQLVRWDFGGSLVLRESPPNSGFTILTKGHGASADSFVG